MADNSNETKAELLNELESIKDFLSEEEMADIPLLDQAVNFDEELDIPVLKDTVELAPAIQAENLELKAENTLKITTELPRGVLPGQRSLFEGPLITKNAEKKPDELDNKEGTDQLESLFNDAANTESVIGENETDDESEEVSSHSQNPFSAKSFFSLFSKNASHDKVIENEHLDETPEQNPESVESLFDGQSNPEEPKEETKSGDDLDAIREEIAEKNTESLFADSMNDDEPTAPEETTLTEPDAADNVTSLFDQVEDHDNEIILDDAAEETEPENETLNESDEELLEEASEEQAEENLEDVSEKVETIDSTLENNSQTEKAVLIDEVVAELLPNIEQLLRDKLSEILNK